MKYKLLSGNWYSYTFDCRWERIFALANKIPLKVRKAIVKLATYTKNTGIPGTVEKIGQSRRGI